MSISPRTLSATVAFVKLYTWLAPMLLFTWLSSMFLHEMGHVICGWMIGGTFRYIDVYPFHFSTTILQPNPNPVLVTWSGLLLGWALPLLTIPLWRMRWAAIGPLLQSWSGYCWLAFGSYLALAAGESLSDTGQLLAQGWPVVLLVCIGAAVAISGYIVGRRSVSQLFSLFAVTPPSWQAILFAYAIFFSWYVMQYGVARWMNPTI